MWLRWASALRAGDFYTPQHCLMPRWYTSIPQAYPARLSRPRGVRSRLLVAQGMTGRQPAAGGLLDLDGGGAGDRRWSLGGLCSGRPQ